jgi:hypothetical protein
VRSGRSASRAGRAQQGASEIPVSHPTSLEQAPGASIRTGSERTLRYEVAVRQTYGSHQAPPRCQGLLVPGRDPSRNMRGRWGDPVVETVAGVGVG